MEQEQERASSVPVPCSLFLDRSLMAKIAPSILTADMGRLADQVREAEAAGCEYIHLDVMDGKFVPVITFGPLVVNAVRKAVNITLDIHLMIERPEDQVAAFRDAGGDILNFHVEATHAPPPPRRRSAAARRPGRRQPEPGDAAQRPRRPAAARSTR